MKNLVIGILMTMVVGLGGLIIYNSHIFSKQNVKNTADNSLNVPSVHENKKDNSLAANTKESNDKEDNNSKTEKTNNNINDNYSNVENSNNNIKITTNNDDYINNIKFINNSNDKEDNNSLSNISDLELIDFSSQISKDDNISLPDIIFVNNNEIWVNTGTEAVDGNCGINKIEALEQTNDYIKTKLTLQSNGNDFVTTFNSQSGLVAYNGVNFLVKNHNITKLEMRYRVYITSKPEYDPISKHTKIVKHIHVDKNRIVILGGDKNTDKVYCEDFFLKK